MVFVDIVDREEVLTNYEFLPAQGPLSSELQPDAVLQSWERNIEPGRSHNK